MTQTWSSVTFSTDSEPLLATLVRDWAAERLPGRPQIGDRAAAVAIARYRDGSTVAEACRDARSFVECVARHPSSMGPTDWLVLPHAS